MSAWLSLSALSLLSLLAGPVRAEEPTREDATYDRLFGAQAAPQDVTAPPELPSLVPIWAIPVLLMAAGGGAFLYMRQRSAAVPAGSMRVLQRQPIGERNAVVLLEYTDTAGEARRYLIGTGAGSPVLLVDLGLEEQAQVEQAQEARTIRSAAAPESAALADATPANVGAAGWSQRRSDVYRPSDVRGDVRGEVLENARETAREGMRSDARDAEARRADSILESRRIEAREQTAREEGARRNVADEILAERKGAGAAGAGGAGAEAGGAGDKKDEFSKILARIGE